VKQNSRRLYNTTGIATGVTHILELLVKEFFKTIFTFREADLSSRGK
jgi:hypothetical protein